MDAKKIISDLTAVTKKWTKQRKAEERRQSAAARRAYLFHKARDTIKDAAYQVMEAAYLKASDNGSLPAQARQIMYAARGEIQDITGEPLNDTYFTQTLLPDYLNDHPSETAGWDVVFDARGHFLEPHTSVNVPLGTLQVRNYLVHGEERGKDRPVKIRVLYPADRSDRFGAVLFIEKEGFLPLFQRVRLAERYDLAIMSTKGQSVTAARALVDELCGGQQIPLLVLHDFDKSGFSILGLFQRDNRRYTYRHRLKVIDLGLRLADVQKCGLEPEDVAIQNTYAVHSNLLENGASAEEAKFLCLGQRVELNAFTSRALVDWIEGKLKEQGIKKVIPAGEVLADAFQAAYIRASIHREIQAIRDEAAKEASGLTPPTHKQISKVLAEHATWPWDRAVAQLARERLIDAAANPARGERPAQ
jgi:hypothetical protein